MRFGEVYRICKDNYDIINDYYFQVVNAYKKFADMNEDENIDIKPYEIGCKDEDIDAKQYWKEDENDGVRLYSVKKKDLETPEINYTKEISKNLNTISKIVSEVFGDIKCLEKGVGKVCISNLTQAITIEQKISDVKELLIQLECIIQLYESLEQKEQGIGLDIKVPEIDDITQFKKCIDELEFIFTKCPFFQSNEASLKFRNVDIGSTWIIIGVSSVSIAAASVLLNNIAAFIDKCLIIRSHKKTCEMQQREINKFDCNQKEKEKLMENIIKVYKISVSNAIKELEETTGCHIQDGDERGRSEQALEKLEQLIDKGLQIYSAIGSPPEVKVLFEPLEMHYLSIVEELKRIEKKSDDGDKE